MTDASTIHITMPSLRGSCWVHLDPSSERLTRGCRFETHGEATAYAQDLAAQTGWQIEDASKAPLTIDLLTDQIAINDKLWLMAGLVHDDKLGWSDNLPPAEIAREIAGIVARGWETISEADQGMLLGIGAALLKCAAEDSGAGNVDDVLGDIMVLPPNAVF